MNNRMVEGYLEPAFQALRDYDIAVSDDEDNKLFKINKEFRSKIAAYGAAVTMGSLLSGTAFYSAQGKSEKERQNLMRAIYGVLHWNAKPPIDTKNVHGDTLFHYVKDNNNRATKEQVLAAATALKLAMNLYRLVE